jgi:hypothetical protein
MAIVGEKRGLFPELKRWVAEGRPVSAVIFGTTYRTEDLGHLRRHDPKFLWFAGIDGSMVTEHDPRNDRLQLLFAGVQRCTGYQDGLALLHGNDDSHFTIGSHVHLSVAGGNNFQNFGGGADMGLRLQRGDHFDAFSGG